MALLNDEAAAPGLQAVRDVVDAGEEGCR